MLKRSLYLLVAATFAVLAVPAQAARVEGGTTASQGVMRCGGNHFLRLGGSEVHFTTYALRNFDASTAISINRMRVFDGPGNVLFDSASSTLPPSDSGLLGPGNNSLGPNQSVLFNTLDFLPFLPDTNRPLQMEIQWSAARRVVTLDAITVRISRERNPGTGMQLEERGRHAVECSTISLK